MIGRVVVVVTVVYRERLMCRFVGLVVRRSIMKQSQVVFMTPPHCVVWWEIGRTLRSRVCFEILCEALEYHRQVRYSQMRVSAIMKSHISTA